MGCTHFAASETRDYSGKQSGQDDADIKPLPELLIPSYPLGSSDGSSFCSPSEGGTVDMHGRHTYISVDIGKAREKPSLQT